MKKSIVALCLGLMVTTMSVGATSMVSKAVELPFVPVVEINNQEADKEEASKEQETVGEADKEEASKEQENVGETDKEEVSKEQETAGEANNQGASQLQTETLTVELIQDGYFHNAQISVEEAMAIEEVAPQSAKAVWNTFFTQRVTQAIRNFEKTVDVSDLGIAVSDENVRTMVDLYQEIVDSNPDFFYAAGSFGYSYYKGGNVVRINLRYDGYSDANGNVDMAKVNAYQAAKDKAMAVVKAGMTDIEKLLALHDYLVLNCEYDYDDYLAGTLQESVYSSYGALVNRTAVCSGYATAYSELVRTAGIPCYIVASDKMDHAWNLVYADGAWHHIDVTFDDPQYVGRTGTDYSLEGAVSHTYFMKSDAEMKSLGHHDWFQEYTYSQLPAASVSNSYPNAVFRKKSDADGEPMAEASFSYHNGDWYYLTNTSVENYGSGYISRSKLNGEERITWVQEGAFEFMQMVDGRFYYADDRGIYTATIHSDLTPERIMTMVGSKNYRECVLTEFVAKGDGSIVCEVKDVYSNKYYKLNTTTAAREKAQLPKLVITNTPTINYYAQDNQLAMDGKYSLRYSDGSLLSVRAEGVDTYDYDLSQEGVYNVEVFFRHEEIKAAYQVSVKKDFPIADVLATTENWQYNGIRYVYDKGYMNGVDAVHFWPNENLTRAMLAQILYNMEGTPEVAYQPVFTDVAQGAWYANAILWAYQKGIASGYDTGVFGAEDNITREQAAVMLKQYADMKEIDTTGRVDVSGYTDAALIHSWALDAISWANSSEVMSGKLGNILDPLGNATRAEMATMITNYCTNVQQ